MTGVGSIRAMASETQEALDGAKKKKKNKRRT